MSARSFGSGLSHDDALALLDWAYANSALILRVGPDAYVVCHPGSAERVQAALVASRSLVTDDKAVT